MRSTLAELPVDAMLGDLRGVLSPGRVLDACRAELARIEPHVRGAWRDCRVIEALYHPGRYVRVAYVLLADPATPAEREWPQGEIVYLHAPVRQPVSRRGEVLRIGGVEFEAYAFPNDRRLREMRRFAGKESSLAAWQEWLRVAGDASELDGESLQRLLMRYVPEQKWVIRLRAEARGAGRVSGKLRLAVRVGDADAVGELENRHRRLSASARGAAGPLAIPDVVGSDAQAGLLGVEWLRGDALLDALAQRDSAETLALLARALHDFHRLDHAGCVVGPAGEVSERVRAAAADLSAAYPELTDAMREIVEAADSLRDSPAPTVLLHNDFHWNQVTIRRERVAMLDLERVSLGDALIDVGNFVAQLRMLPLRDDLDQPVDAALAERWAGQFLEAWRCETGQAIDAERFALAAALSRIELARGLMRHLRPGARRVARECVSAALLDLRSTAGALR